MRLAALVLLLTLGISRTALAVPMCESFEYAELKEMQTKPLQNAYCDNFKITNELYGVIGRSLNADATEALRARDHCWQAAEKMRRLPRFKSIKTECPNVRRIDPLDAANEESKRQMDRALENLRRDSR